MNTTTTTNTDKQIKVNLKRKSHHHQRICNDNDERSSSSSFIVSSKESMIEYNATMYTPVTYAHDNNNNNTCVICLDDISHNNKHFLHCGHQFHCRCIKQWLTRNKYCPVCKSPSKGCCNVDNDNDNDNVHSSSSSSSSNYFIDVIQYDNTSSSPFDSIERDAFYTLIILIIISFITKIISRAFSILIHKLFT